MKRMTLTERKPQEETKRHEESRVESKALLRFCVVDLCLANITAIDTKEY
jgi:hypothetical protein